MHLIDIGANLTHDAFRPDFNAVLQRAHDVGVDQLIVTGADKEHSIQAQRLAEKYPGKLFATAGVHPHWANEWDAETAETLTALTTQPGVVAVGECGLDYNRNHSTPALQRQALIAQLEIAVATQLPVFMHERDAHADFHAILQDYRPTLSRAVVHCFTGNQAELEAYLALDLHIGITGWICDERRGHHLHEFVDQIPSDRLMIETDCPYLLPRDLKPKPKSRRNEPMYLAHIAEVIAHHRQVPVTQLATETLNTTQAFFALTTPC